MKLHLPTAAGKLIAVLRGKRCTQADDQQLRDSDGGVDTAVVSLQLSGVLRPRFKHPRFEGTLAPHWPLS